VTKRKGLTENKIEEVREFLESYVKFQEKWNEEAFRIFMKKFKKFENEIDDYDRYSIGDFIKFACEVRGIPAELSHRLVGDFVWFMRKAYRKIKDAWLWNFWEYFYYFYRFYVVRFSEEVMERIRNEK